MSSTYYSSLSGMIAASLGLQNTSNNVANMQSPGFKRNDLFYSSLGNGSGDDSMGQGVHVNGSCTNFKEGDHLQTGNATDLALVGDSFFVIRLKNNLLSYTRNGEFEFIDGILTDKHSGGQVQGYNSAGELVPIREKGPKESAGKASHEIYLKGKFIREEKSKDELDRDPNPIKSKYKDIYCELQKIYDAQGKPHTLKLEFESIADMNEKDPEPGRSWKLARATYDSTEIKWAGEQQIIFKDNLGAISDNSTIKLTLNNQQDIKIYFGNYLSDGQNDSVTIENSKNNPEGTQIEVYQNDGYSTGKHLSFSFDENGQITYFYDNGRSIKGIHVGLARFDNMEHNLIQTEDNLFKTKTDTGVHYGRANKNGFAAIRAKELEQSNVDSTKEFANIVVLQRMFQACSQIMDIDKQLLEELESKS
ncbi:MAG: flagellar hook-basal body complex protein [Legionella sp.]|nr:flagellar hook-basal body complex protein [Legionella sp.]